jgi:hypothetical protein
MTLSQQPAVADVRISAIELKSRLDSGESVTIIDVRNDHAWESSPLKIRGAERIRPADWRIDPSWPKDRLTALY